MREIIALLFWMSWCGVSFAGDPVVVSPAELKARADQYFGREISVVGHIAQSTREDATFGIDAGEAGVITFGVWWGMVRGEAWERAMLTCGAGFRADDLCKVTVTGTVEQNQSFPNLFSLKNASIKFLN